MFCVFKETKYGRNLEFECAEQDEVFARLNKLDWYPHVGYHIYQGTLAEYVHNKFTDSKERANV
jgi:hypothetical protein